jgi:hypothetical protein
MLASREFKVLSVYFFNTTLKTVWVFHKNEILNNATK